MLNRKQKILFFLVRILTFRNLKIQKRKALGVYSGLHLPNQSAQSNGLAIFELIS